MTLLSLLSAAGEGSRELDLEIWNAISKDAPWRFVDIDDETITCDRYGPGSVGNPVVSLNRFSRDLASAMLLIPDACPFALHRGRDGRWGAEIVAANSDDRLADIDDAATPALALCIACIKARLPTPTPGAEDRG